MRRSHRFLGGRAVLVDEFTENTIQLLRISIVFEPFQKHDEEVVVAQSPTIVQRSQLRIGFLCQSCIEPFWQGRRFAGMFRTPFLLVS